MKTELFIAGRILKRNGTETSHSRPIIRIAIAGVALGMMVMIAAIAIVTGFKSQIREKIIGFGSHIQLSNYDNNLTFETTPIMADLPFLNDIKEISGVEHVQAYALKGGIIKTKKQMQAIGLKGIDKNFDWTFFKQNMVEGQAFSINDTAVSNSIVISKYLANLLQLKPGDFVPVYFIQQPPRVRKFKITGIYRTSIEDFDKTFVVIDMRHIQKLNSWTEKQVSGYEITVKDFNQLDQTADSVFMAAGYTYLNDYTTLNITTIKDKYPQIFSWLRLLDMNVWVILGLMVLVAGLNMISGILILILERLHMIGILKSQGMTNWGIRKIFLFEASYLTLYGLLWGNVLGIGFCLVQKYTGLIGLEESTYYLSVVPIQLDAMSLLVLNIGALVVIFLMMLLPTWIVSRISPVSTLRFE